ncbi:ABC transporter ATP-binding protein [Streptomyces sp. GQFP]|uniref:ABC transporter ATP-binding protein n=1 Tax=Streptomyces sp. GQFP TaxID=2907545 RepID=UPI001F41BD84|nr:ATP-binding cassette domain-containing protein [Streptomyces sp. GQFP]UIX29190.1 ATP-binding cassette domain-containing protein [Streptomyces sp. GQFP]
MTLTEQTPQRRDSAYALLEVDGVSKHFGGRGHGRFTAVDDVSLTFDSTKMIGIVGESGSGKSTLARMMVGLEHPSSGSVTLNGREMTSLLGATRTDRVYARRTLQFVGQDTTSSFDPRRTLRDAVRRPATLLHGLDKDAADARVDSVLERLGLSPAQADRYPSEVSGGQRQRFALARGMVVSPRLLVCDEVVSALDVSVQGSILNLLKKYCAEEQAGLTFVSHGLPATAFIADELVVMYHGKIVEHGPTQRIIDAPEHPYTMRLLDAYRGPATPAAQG